MRGAPCPVSPLGVVTRGCLCLAGGGLGRWGSRPPCLSPCRCPAVLSPPLSVAACPDPGSEPRGEPGTPKSTPPELSQVGACCSSPPRVVPRGSPCVTRGAVPRLSFLARCQRGELVGAGCRRRWGGGSPCTPELHPSLTPPGGVAWSLCPGLHEGAFPVGLLFAWEVLAVEGKGVSLLAPPSFMHRAPGGMQLVHGPLTHPCPFCHPGEVSLAPPMAAGCTPKTFEHAWQDRSCRAHFESTQQPPPHPGHPNPLLHPTAPPALGAC